MPRGGGKGFGNLETDSEAEKFGPERLPQDHPLMGNKETFLEYTMSLSRQGKRLDGSLLSDHRRRVIMQYIEESMDSIGSDPVADSTENVEPVPRAVDMDVRMEDDSVPEESDIAYHQEVMTGYENKPIVPISD